MIAFIKSATVAFLFAATAPNICPATVDLSPSASDANVAIRFNSTNVASEKYAESTESSILLYTTIRGVIEPVNPTLTNAAEIRPPVISSIWFTRNVAIPSSLDTLIVGNVKLTIPPGVQSGQKLRLPEKGLFKKSGRGDLMMEIQICVPKDLTSEEKKLFEKLAKKSEFNPR